MVILHLLSITDDEAPQKDVALKETDTPMECAPKTTTTTSEETTASATAEEVLDPEILMILGEDHNTQKEYGEDFHKDIAARWLHILCNGLPKESKSDLLKQYLPAKNCVNMKAPKLNLEIEAALSAINVKKDLFSQSKQNQLSSCLAAIGKVLNWALSSKDVSPQAQNIIKPLSDAGRLLCDSHFRESQSRRYAIINNLNKQTRDSVKNTKIDEFLFGASLAEHIKTSKAVSKTGSEMKSTAQRAPFKPPPPTTQNQRGALNVRGTSRAVAFEPRQNPAPRRQAPAPRDRRQEYNRRSSSSRRGFRRQ